MEDFSNRNGSKYIEIVRLTRPHQWIKNCAVFLSVIFSGKFLDLFCWKMTLLAAICFCLISSSIYCLNDIIDKDSDRKDSEKSNRPIASGKVTVYEAATTGIIMAVISIILSLTCLPSGCTIILVVYLIMNIMYSLWLKQIMLVDVLIIALGFVFRVIEGGLAADIWISPWIVIMTFLLALFIALSKRRHEVVIVSRSEKKEGRKSVAGYTLPFLNSVLSMLGAVLIIGYIMYTLYPKYGKSPDSEYLYVTSLPVLIAIMRYLQLTIVENKSGDPTKLSYTDVPLMISGIIWLVSFILIADL